MNKLIYTAYSPNTRLQDIKKSISLLFSPTKWKKGDSINKLKTFFSLKFKTNNIYLFNHARTALYLALKEMNLKPDDEVIIQAFTCVASVNPIIWAGGKPIFIDINPDTLNINYEDFIKKVNIKTKAVIFQHTFGKAKGIEEIAQYCKEKNIILIEDCAHMIGSKSNGKLAGTFGDLAIFSLGRDKSFSAVDGGILLINNEYFNMNFLKSNSALLNENLIKNYPSVWWVIKRLLFQPFWAIIKCTYPIYIGKGIHAILSLTGLLSRATTNKEKSGIFDEKLIKLMPNAIAEMANRQLEDFETINKERMRKYLLYKENFKQFNDIEMIDFDSEEIPLRLPILVRNPEKLLKYLERENIILGDWYNQVIAPKEVNPSKFGYVNGTCPIAESISSKIINLPLHINISDKDIMKITKEMMYYISNKSNNSFTE